MANVKIITDNKLITVHTPYHPEFPARARKLGGTWDGSARAWIFDARDTERVRELCREIYGTDGAEGAGELVTLRVTYPKSYAHDALDAYVAGRQVARAFERDGGARLGEGVVVIEGRGFDSGGSRKNPCVNVSGGTVIEVRDVPAGAKLEADLCGEVEVVGGEVDRETLMAERGRLLERLAEIEKRLTE